MGKLSQAGTVFFDLDGTLTDPKEGITRCIQYALEKLEVEAPSQDDLEWCIGPPLYHSMEVLVGVDRVTAAVDLYRERFADVGWSENVPYTDIEGTLGHLRERDVRLYVATSKPHVFARRILDHFELSHYFHGIYGSELDGTHSNKADLLRYARQHAGVTGHAAMIGDREHDVIGALANDIEAIGVTYGYGDYSELEAAGAHHIVDTPHAIRECFG